MADAAAAQKVAWLPLRAVEYFLTGSFFVVINLFRVCTLIQFEKGVSKFDREFFCSRKLRNSLRTGCISDLEAKKCLDLETTYPWFDPTV